MIYETGMNRSLHKQVYLPLHQVSYLYTPLSANKYVELWILQHTSYPSALSICVETIGI